MYKPKYNSPVFVDMSDNSQLIGFQWRSFILSSEYVRIGHLKDQLLHIRMSEFSFISELIWYLSSRIIHWPLYLCGPFSQPNIGEWTRRGCGSHPPGHWREVSWLPLWCPPRRVYALFHRYRRRGISPPFESTPRWADRSRHCSPRSRIGRTRSPGREISSRGRPHFDSRRATCQKGKGRWIPLRMLLKIVGPLLLGSRTSLDWRWTGKGKGSAAHPR